MATIAAQEIGQIVPPGATAGPGLSSRISQAIQLAANKTGVNFAYLLDKAQQESGFDPNAKASTSTATGLFQFTGQTWMHMIKEHGAQYNLGDYADHITVNASGTIHASDPVWRKAILDLRKDPQVSAEMAGELDKENGAALKASVGGKVGSTELYLAHFLGAGGASSFLRNLHSDPGASAADILPDAAQSNPTVFYRADGSSRTLGEIYRHFAQKFDHPAKTMVASAGAPGAGLAATLPVTGLAALSPPLATGAAPASAYTLADATAAISHYATGAEANLKTSSSSLFATMILAQMGTSDFTKTSTLDATSREKKTAISVLSAVA
ncbi:MAG: transglycosylase SLT domain-containing protein [Pseudomonadota bacterium]|nr:transglycosylase SLT domain-containing protein [Pseudomonadota bacterium]